MTEQDIAKLHKELYEYFMGIREIDSSFKFRVRRMNNQGRLEKGYWFNGNQNYLETSFWDYKDNLHQTSVIRLVCSFKNEKWRWNCELIGRDNEEREQYFKEMAEDLGFTNDDDRMPIWKKTLEASDNFIEPIQKFIETDKIKIDKYLKENPNDKIIRFIDDYIFKKDIDKISLFINNRQISVSKLPFAVTELDIQNFQGIKSLTLTLNEDGAVPQWIFLTGENSFGKTSILRAIAIGLAGDETNIINKKDSTNIVLHGIKNDKDYTNVKIDSDDEPEKFEYVAAYGVSRLAAQKTSQFVSKTGTLFSDTDFLLNIEDKLQKNSKKFEKITKKLIDIIPNLGKIDRIVDEKTGNPQVFFYEKDANGKTLETPVKLDQLGAGYRSIFMMMGDMLIRLSNDFEKNLDDIAGVVLIDEIDANLHPKYQYDLSKLLSDAFPKVQFIVSTHSPIPLLGLPPKSKLGKKIHTAILKVTRTIEEGVTIERLDDDIDIQVLSANALLTSDIFGFKDIFARGATPDTMKPFNNYDDIKQMKEPEKLEVIKNGLKALKIKL